MNKKTIEVVAAVIKQENKFFIAQRANKGELSMKWEFPGGKIETSETHQDALSRELFEELNIRVNVRDFITTVFHEYNSFKLIMHVYFVDIFDGVIKLNEHLDYKWLSKPDLKNLDLADADKPILDFI